MVSDKTSLAGIVGLTWEYTVFLLICFHLVTVICALCINHASPEMNLFITYSHMQLKGHEGIQETKFNRQVEYQTLVFIGLRVWCVCVCVREKMLKRYLIK